MKFKTIFADNCLHSVIFENDKDEFSKAFENWFDIEYLMEFFEANIVDLRGGFFGNVSLEAAVQRTRNEAKALEKRLIAIGTLKGKIQREAIDALFVPLDDNMAYDLRSKAKGMEWKSWLRIYALKFDEKILVTGSAIKLTRTMKEREHTAAELEKLRRVQDFLYEQGVADKDGFTALISEI